MKIREQKRSSGTVNSSPICDFFASIHPLSKDAAACIAHGTFPEKIAKGKYLIKPGTNNTCLYFIVKGVIRGFIKEQGKEITTWINEENEIVGSIRNLGLDIPSEEYLQAVETTRLIALPVELIEHLYTHFPEMNIIGRKILEENYRGAEERAYICRLPSAEKRYKRFLQKRGSLLNRIPLRLVASYLGMTVETLSRIRSKKNETFA